MERRPALGISPCPRSLIIDVLGLYEGRSTSWKMISRQGKDGGRLHGATLQVLLGRDHRMVTSFLLGRNHRMVTSIFPNDYCLLIEGMGSE